MIMNVALKVEFLFILIMSLIVSFIILKVFLKKHTMGKIGKIIIFILITILTFFILYSIINYHPSHEIVV